MIFPPMLFPLSTRRAARAAAAVVLGACAAAATAGTVAATSTTSTAISAGPPRQAATAPVASAAASGAAGAAGAERATALPGDSLYRLDTVLTDAAGRRFTLRDMAGAPLLVTMFYGDCNAACPIILETMKRTVAALGPEGKPLRVLLVSLDPLQDSPAGLAILAGKHELAAPRFRLAVARDESQTRLLASALNIKFRALGNGEINHTTRVVLLDAAGTPQAASTRLDAEPDPALLQRIAALLKKEKQEQIK